jgi:DNA-binding MarR family transcriptional regulator
MTNSSAELAGRLRAAVSELVRATRSRDRLPPIPSAVLDLLNRQGPMSTADLAAHRQVRHQTMAGTVSDLLERGYVAAAPDPGDGRKKTLTLTTRGRAALEADRRQRIEQLGDAISQTMAAEERELLGSALPLIERIAARVKENAGPGTRQSGPLTGDW